MQHAPGIVEMIRLKLLDWSDLIDMSDKENPTLKLEYIARLRFIIALWLQLLSRFQSARSSLTGLFHLCTQARMVHNQRWCDISSNCRRSRLRQGRLHSFHLCKGMRQVAIVQPNCHNQPRGNSL